MPTLFREFVGFVSFENILPVEKFKSICRIAKLLGDLYRGKTRKAGSALLRMRLLLAIDGLKREFDAVFV